MKHTLFDSVAKVLFVCISSFLFATASGKGAELVNNLVVNGSFESGLTPGWVLQSGNIDHVCNWVSADGCCSLDLNGDTAGTIRQVIFGFSPEQSYRLSFLLAGNPGGGPAVKTIRASIGGVSQEYSFNVIGFSSANMGWTLQSLDFTASGSTLTLSFMSLTEGNGGPALDGVVITPTPAVPRIIKQPASQSALVGGNATFTVIVIGSSSLNYQWRKDGLAMVGRNGSSLSLTNLQPSDIGTYDVVATNSLGAVTSRLARLSVVNFGAPEIRADGEPLIEDVIRGDQSTISMSTLFPDGTVFYTTDGSNPTFASTPYAGSFVITQSTTIRAIAYNVDFTQSAENGPFQNQIVPAYALSTSVTGQGTVGACPNGPRYASGTAVTLSALPDAGWRFLCWQGDACGAWSGATILMDANKVVTAVFEPIPTYALTATTAGGGTISGNSGSPYFEGTVVNLTAQPASGWQFLGWQGDASGATTSMSMTMDRAKDVQALFGTSVPTTVGGSGSLTLNPAQGPYPYGSTVRISARPNVGSYFAVWGSAASGRANPLHFVVTNANPTVSALFAPLQGSDVNVYVNANGEGTVSASPNLQPYPQGTPVTLTATPSPGWHFVEWQGDASGTSTNATVVLNGNKTVTAVFQVLPRYTLATTTPGGGIISGNTGSPYAEEDVVNLTAQPASGWQFLGWQGDASGPIPNVAVTMDRAKNVQAVFGTVSVVTNVVGPGTVTLSPAQGPYPYGSTVRLTATPSAGYDFILWGNAASGTENPLDYVVTTATPAICALFGPTGTSQSPTITAQPASQVVASGSVATLSVIAGGPEPYGYQWQNSAGPIPDATNATYTLDPALTNHTDNYAVVVSNPYGMVKSQVAILTVYDPVTIASQPAQQVVPFRGTAAFSVVANGFPAPTYQWLFNGESLAGANGASLIITNVGTNALGAYSVIAWNAYSAATSSVAMLLMSPSILSPFLGATVTWGKSATLSASAVGSDDLSYQWFKDGAPILWGTNSTLVFSMVQISDAGLYSVVVSSPWGSATNTPAQLVVNPANISLAMYAGITIDGVPGYTYGIQYSTDLRDTNAWVNVTNLTLSVPVETWIDLESAGRMKRFYRVVVP